ncbi:MAG TPA: homocysteine S-methyltransferase family protein [Candidatus Limnocylindrales bacterium]|nr:homocysteine S-methyltransferase family protein [Candidatus Limnocylindrales bacterium]
MAKYRENLPQLKGDLFLTDGGIETTLIFNEGLDLPYFAAFDLLKHTAGQAALRKYFQSYSAIARKYSVGLILESATWRASSDWGEKLGYSHDELVAANRQAMAILHEVRREYETEQTPMVISGCIGPRGDGYNPASFMSEAEAEYYHGMQTKLFRDVDADLVTAITMTYPEEAIGIVRAGQSVGMPVVISFTVETDGRLPNGQSLHDAIAQVDRATGNAPVYYMINCAHPSHFTDRLDNGAPWLRRIRGLRANASPKSHKELDEATSLDAGDPADLANRYRALMAQLSNLNVVGGCCGTDPRHIEAIYRAVRS